MLKLSLSFSLLVFCALVSTQTFADNKSSDAVSTKYKIRLQNQDGSQSEVDVQHAQAQMQIVDKANEVLPIVPGHPEVHVLVADDAESEKRADSIELDLERQGLTVTSIREVPPEPSAKKNVYVKPAKSDIYIGVYQAGIKGFSTYFIYVSVGLSPVRSFQIASILATYDFLTTVYYKTLDNFFAGRSRDEVRGDKMSLKEWMRRCLTTGTIGAATRWFTGPTGAAHAITTVNGWVEIAWNTLAKGTSGIFFGGMVDKKISDQNARWHRAIVYSVGTILGTFDMAGWGHWSISLVSIDPIVIEHLVSTDAIDLSLRGTAAAIVTWYFANAMLVKTKPQWVESFINYLRKPFQKNQNPSPILYCRSLGLAS